MTEHLSDYTLLQSLIDPSAPDHVVRARVVRTLASKFRRHPGLATVGQVRRLSDCELLAVRNIGPRGLAWIRAVMGPYEPAAPPSLREFSFCGNWEALGPDGQAAIAHLIDAIANAVEAGWRPSLTAHVEQES